MTLILLLLAALLPSTTSVTIHTTTHHQEAPMAQPISYPERHPNAPTAFSVGTGMRVGRDARNPSQRMPNHIAMQGQNLQPVEHTNRPSPR